MGIELPAELADVAAQTGVKWPEADEDKMRETARAWQETGQNITSLISEADSTARSALGTTEGASADAARKHWGTYVQPDTGRLTSMAHGCTKAADQLDHAAKQVADAKLAIVQNLVPLAKNKDVAEHAASSGHPTALLGLDTAIRGTAANMANVHSTLVTAVQPVTGVTMDAAQPLVNTHPGDHGQRPGLLQNVVQPVVGGPGHGQGLLQGVVQPVVDTVAGGSGHGPGVVPGLAQPVVDAVAPGGHGGTLPEPGDIRPGVPDPATGPIHQLGYDAPTPPRGLPDHGVQAASAAVLDAPPPQAQQAAPVSQPPPPAAAGGGSQFGGPPPPPTPQAPPPVAAQPIPGQQPVQRGPAPVVMSGEPVRQAPVAGVAAQPAAPIPVKPAQERETVIAIWLVRMFPIGHMPVAADRPARQLPPPRPEFDYAAGMRFEPHDHPESGLIDDAEALAWAIDGGDAVEALPGEPAPAELLEAHDPLGGQNERDWARRFVVRAGSGRDTLDTEYAWPPSEIFPEGATAPGEPEILEPGTVIDRFGTPEGRVFAAADTAFAQRTLPPSHVYAGYRRYRVLKPLPVWRGVSAAWFGQNGGGERFRTVYPAVDLIALGYLAEERNEG